MSEPQPPHTTWHAPPHGPPPDDGAAAGPFTRVAGGFQHVLGRRWIKIVLAIVIVLAAAATVADRVELGYYVISPGIAQPVGPLVKVPGDRSHRSTGKVLLTDVFVTRVSALSYVFDELRPNSTVVPAVTVLGPATPPAQLSAQGYLEMAQSQSAAKAAALSRLGYKVGEHDVGTIVFSVVPGSPAASVLSVGQIVTAVDGRPTPDACAFTQALARHRAGQRVTLSIEHSKVNAHAELVPGRTVPTTVTLARWPRGVRRASSTPACPLHSSARQGFLGVEAETQANYTFPLRVSLRTTSIGGPSAGLAMTLGIVDALDGGRLTGGRTIAATGTITPTGGVGEVGGVPQKTVAVENAGASVFFVPEAQVRTARSKATPSLRIFGVRSLTQVLSILRRLGGTVPPQRSLHPAAHAGASSGS